MLFFKTPTGFSPCETNPRSPGFGGGSFGGGRSSGSGGGAKGIVTVAVRAAVFAQGMKAVVRYQRRSDGLRGGDSAESNWNIDGNCTNNTFETRFLLVLQ